MKCGRCTACPGRHRIISKLSVREGRGRNAEVSLEKEKERQEGNSPQDFLCEGIHVHLLLAEVPEHLDQLVREGVEVDVEFTV